MSNVLFYVSGHGYGHSVRIAEVIRALPAAASGVKITVRTAAPESLFRGDPADSPTVFPAKVDPDVVEQGIFRIDWVASAAKLADFLSYCDKVAAGEVAWIQPRGIDLIVADIPFLAGRIASATGIPCLGISNFLWDWIYEPMLADYDGGAALLETVREAYARFDCVLRLPFAHAMPGLRKVIDVPLVAPVTKRSRSEILHALAIDEGDDRPRVLLSLREASQAGPLVELATRERGLLFLQAGDVPPGGPSNLREVRIGNELNFADLISVADVVVGKPGYGMMAACAAHRKRLLYVPRVGFREDEALLAGAVGCITLEALPRPEFETGAWGSRLRSVLSRPEPQLTLDVDGADFCAKFISRRLQGESLPEV